MSENPSMTNSPSTPSTPSTASPAFQLVRQPSGRLLFIGANGEQHAGVVPVRAFPLAAPDEGISLVSTEGHELAWVEQLQDRKSVV